MMGVAIQMPLKGYMSFQISELWLHLKNFKFTQKHLIGKDKNYMAFLPRKFMQKHTKASVKKTKTWHNLYAGGTIKHQTIIKQFYLHPSWCNFS